MSERHKINKCGDEIIEYIKSHHKTDTPFKIAHDLHISDQTVYNYIHALGLSVYTFRWNEEHKQQLARLVKRGSTTYSMAKFFGVLESSVKKEVRILLRQGYL